MQVTVVSLNGLQELSGGGLYLRSLVQGLLDTGAVRSMTVVSKNIQVQEPAFRHEAVHEQALEKSVVQDVLARMRLQPTFLGVHQAAIAAACEPADLVVFHNSRSGLILNALKRRFPGKKFLMASDNVEADLLRQHRSGKRGLANLAARLEEFEIRRAEACCLRADAMTFITRADLQLFEASYGRPAVTEILPITVKAAAVRENAVDTRGRGYVLFTGHFGFQPNVDSLEVLLQVARVVNEGREPAAQIAFIVAGAGLDKLPPPGVVGVTYRSSPSVLEMDALFSHASCYLAPVLWGSGMKTKVAEALSYGLPVVALPNAGVGYEQLLADPACALALRVVQDVPGMVAGLKKCMAAATLPQARSVALQAYETWYSSRAQGQRFLGIFERLGLV
ncbi:glycosyltransferase [Kerstersia gyiorum]|jgi:glycosyltransferase involved in cell wall biosynthesis|uniref:glycosyltransferase n=2 Tax=Kerstersia gyiorum TaxID=206506 RepID=UPI00242C2BE1|nr:glycosyltransferase [Kerstersia gyiorum]MCI1228815.1 glycosyltransferase [Kerstersia gyiorum]